nr:immunoglobulin heavy chain junction region [Mus musculus]MBK4198368.1 immunoglobulin heavy chain junction region [Mus musculus]
CVRQGRFAYW